MRRQAHPKQALKINVHGGDTADIDLPSSNDPSTLCREATGHRYCVNFGRFMEEDTKKAEANLPLAVDLDGTLIRTDSLQESLLQLLRAHPEGLIRLPTALLRGRAAFKQAVMDAIDVDDLQLPINASVLDFLQTEKQTGRQILLVTAANHAIAEAIAEGIGLFDAVIASDATHNLKGQHKADALVARFGARGFDYIGDSRADLPVWQQARKAYVVGDQRLLQAACQVADAEAVPGKASERSRLPAILHALRPHQWVKNLLLFLPLVAAHMVTDSAALVAVILAFVAFSLTASAVYLLNDLLDLPADRRHPRKRQRPFAAGDLPLHWGVLLAPALLMAAALLSVLALPDLFALVLAGYFLLTTAYSFSLKRKPVVDVILLAALYTVRVIAGAAAVAIVPSFWLLAFSMFIFLSLALAKRYTELDGLRERGELTAAGRGWHVDDLPLVQTLGTGAGLASVLVLALYINSAQAQQLYATSEILWLVCPLLLYWIARLWFKTHRGEMHDDPVVFALRDRVSLATGALTALTVFTATAGLPR